MKGILMKPDNIRLIREGKKTQTRRVEASLKAINEHPDEWQAMMYVPDWDGWHFINLKQTNISRVVKPRYLPGDVVYVKEAWALCNCDRFKEPHPIYKADGLTALPQDWKSPLFMPSGFARTFLRIKDVRPERLQDITEEDALAEGVERREGMFWTQGSGLCATARQAYFGLWDSINGALSAQASPWVWVYSFSLEESK